ncbi:TonB-dependent receptor domain-containing protein [Marinobacter bohaiensis]|uniref:TonB-dependent receptor domain-containing protein n=1 Tax=Marinobacter bohaiensis TaxID=2201898 RepID=UPI000DAD2659|nr:TonB-dependent receptor [Marinobacter bohaiensis]
MSHLPARHSLAVAIAAILAAPALAQESESTEDESRQLDPIQVIGEQQSLADAVITAETLERYQADDLEDVFASQPDVAVGGALGIAQKVYVRGFEDSQLNVSIDGATQAGSLFHHNGRLAIEPELLKEVDVHAGAGRATEGPGALGGSIRFVTKDPTDMLRPGEQAGALLKFGGFSNTDGYKASGHLFGRLSDRWSAMVSVTQSDHENYEDGDGNEVEGTEQRQQLGFAKIVGELPADQTLRLSYEVRTDEGERPQRPQWVVSGFNSLYDMDGERDTATLNYTYAPEANPWVELDATVYHTESDVEQNVADRWGRYFGSSRSIGGDVHNVSRLGAHSVTYGVDYRDDRVNAGGADDRTAEEETGTVLGFYLQDDYAVTDSVLLSAGVRYDRYTLDDNNDQSFDDEGVSPNVNVAWGVTDGLTLKAGYAEAFRGPTPHGAFKLESSSNDPDLEAEEATNTEVGFDYVLGGFTLSGEVYRQRIDNAIADPLFGPIIYQNVGDLESEGYLVSTGYRWESLFVGLSFHHNDAEIDGDPLTVYEHNGLGNTIGDTWVAELEYQLNPQWLFGWQGRFVEGISSVDTSVGTIDKPGYGVNDVFVEWLPTGNEDLRLNLTVKNLFDKQYLDHASNADYQSVPGYDGIVGLPEPGRDVRLSIAMRF